MGERRKYPYDLAKIVLNNLNAKNEATPSIDTLINIFESIFSASLNTEELQQTSCSFTYIDSKNPDPEPPKRTEADRWTYVRFENPIEFNANNIVKLSKAADPFTTSIAIDSIDSNPYIWGLIDQAHRYHKFINYESMEVPEWPGLFQISLTGIGIISVFKNYKLIAELRQDTIISTSYDVFWPDPVRVVLKGYIKDYLEDVKKTVGKEIFYVRDHWESSLTAEWLNILRRILLGIKRYKHGGALLIIPNTSTEEDLNIKYKIDYKRLSELIHEAQVKTIYKCTYEDYIYERYTNKGEKNMPLKSYLDVIVSRNEKLDANNGIAGCIRFISSLSCVDGLVLLDKKLDVKGFGVEITCDIELDNVYVAGDSFATTELLKPIDAEDFGTRHRSMLRYCSKYEDSIGFVVSQDSDVRIITKVNDKVVVWENITIGFTPI